MKTSHRFPLLVALPLIAAGCGTATGTTEQANTAETSALTDASPVASATDNAPIDSSASEALTSDTSTTDSSTEGAPNSEPMAEGAEGGAKTYRKAVSPPGMPAEYTAEMAKIAVPMPPKDFKVADAPKLKVTTNKGSFTVQLNAKEAPLHTKSFVYLAKRGFYDGTVFHRFADLTGAGGNIIQGGDPFSKKPATRQFAGMGGPGYEVPRENNNLKHEKLVIAMARSQDPDSAGSQFYITQAPVSFLDEGDGYTVFGKVTDGTDVAMKLRQDDSIKKIELLK